MLVFQEGSGRGTVYFLSTAPKEALGVSSGGLGDSSGGLEALKVIAAPVAETKKAPRVLVESTILRLCGKQMLTLDEIARLLNRSVDGARKEYLQPLLRDKRLTYRYPTNPNHPSQAYLVSGQEVDK